MGVGTVGLAQAGICSSSTGPACPQLALAAEPLPLACPLAGQDVRIAVMQLQHAARLAGQSPPSLLQCAARLCSQDAAGEVQAAASQLHSDDMRQLQQLVALLTRLQHTMGRQSLPQFVQRVLRESGLAQQQQQQQGQQQLGQGQGQGRDELPGPLMCVVHRARQIQAEWASKQSAAAAAAAAGGGSQAFDACPEALMLEGGAEDVGTAMGREEGIALVQDLVAQLALDMLADAAAGGSEVEAGAGALTIATIHSAKGLEWPVVFVPSACQGHLPLRFRPPRDGAAEWGGDGRSLEELQQAHLQEERRLFHVAATRARDRLIVSYVQPLASERGGWSGCVVQKTLCMPQQPAGTACSTQLTTTVCSRRLRRRRGGGDGSGGGSAGGGGK